MGAIVDVLTNIGDLLVSFFSSVASLGPLLSNAAKFLGQFFDIIPTSMNLGITTTFLVSVLYKILGRDS